MTSLSPPLHIPEPRTEGEHYCFALRRHVEGMVRILESVPQEALDWKPSLPDPNSLGAIAVHSVASGEWWILGGVRGDDIPRDRDEEFRATTTAAEMRSRFEAWYTAVEALIRDQPSEWFGQISHHPNGDRTNRRCVMHVVEHLSEHYGQMELTAGLWRAAHEA
jgi:uncharacterized damage-inducible protein DinB